MDIQSERDINNSPLHEEAKEGDPSVGRLQLSKGEVQEMLRSAVRNNNVDKIRRAVEAGANINEDNAEESGTPLHLAAEIGCLAAAKVLLELGADIEGHSGAWGSSPLAAAAWCDRCQLVSFLIDKGADVSRTDHDGHTAMHFAAGNGCAACVRILHDSGGDHRSVAEYGWVPIHEAACIGSQEVVELFFQWGVDVNVEDSFGQTPLGYALNYQREPLVRMLRTKGARCKADRKEEPGKDQ